MLKIPAVRTQPRLQLRPFVDSAKAVAAAQYILGGGRLLEPDHLADGRRDLGEGVGAVRVGSPGGIADAVVQVIAQQADGDLLPGPGQRRRPR